MAWELTVSICIALKFPRLMSSLNPWVEPLPCYSWRWFCSLKNGFQTSMCQIVAKCFNLPFKMSGLGQRWFSVSLLFVEFVCLCVCLCLCFNSLCCLVGILMVGLQVCWYSRLDEGIVFSPQFVSYNKPWCPFSTQSWGLKDNCLVQADRIVSTISGHSKNPGEI